MNKTYLNINYYINIIMTTVNNFEALNTNTEKPRNVTGYIHVNNDDDLSKVFLVLQEFRKLGLKFSHHREYIFFSVKSEHLDKLAQVQPFRISHFRSKSEYKCDKTLADKLSARFDSFVRMTFDETTETLCFLSRTVGKVHNQLVQRIFRDSNENFIHEQYNIVRDYLNTTNTTNTSTTNTTNTTNTNTTNTNTTDTDGFKTITNLHTTRNSKVLLDTQGNTFRGTNSFRGREGTNSFRGRGGNNSVRGRGGNTFRGRGANTNTNTNTNTNA
jgi:hypothetical protein